MTIAPQKGPQELFLSSPADIAIYGGAAGCGKTYALLIEPLRHKDNEGFGAVVFRRNMPQITMEGGLWDTAKEMYTGLDTAFIQSPLRVAFTSGAKIEFHHLQYDETVGSWDGSQIPLILFDELQHFSEYQFFYMLSRNRTSCGIRPYVRATCNPDPDSFLRKLLSWWIDEETGYPIMERSGVIRWMIRLKNIIYWGDSYEELVDEFRDRYAVEDLQPKSVTFIPSVLEDNEALMKANPEYKGNLLALPEYEQLRLLKGNWNARPKAGDLFRRSDFEIIDTMPARANSVVRYWDRAATEQSEASPNPDWTAGVEMCKTLDGQFIITDVARFRKRPLGVKQEIHRIASQNPGATIGLSQDPGSSGVAEVDDLVRYLAGYSVKTACERGTKFTRWKPLSAQVQAHNVKLLRGAWNEAFIDEATNVTDNSKDYDHDDQVDAATGAFMMLVQGGDTDANVGLALAARRGK